MVEGGKISASARPSKQMPMPISNSNK